MHAKYAVPVATVIVSGALFYTWHPLGGVLILGVGGLVSLYQWQASTSG